MNGRMWSVVLAVIITLAGIAGIGWFWRNERIKLRDTVPGSQVILDQQTIDNIVAATHLTPIKTGILVTGIKDMADDDLYLSGYVWQQYDAQWYQAGQGHDIQIPELVKIDKKEIVYEKESAGTKLITWKFGGSLAQPHFDSTHFPLDVRNIHVLVGSLPHDDRTILVPDLAAYATVTPAALPGIDGRVRVNGWPLVRSYYSFWPVNQGLEWGARQVLGESYALCLTIEIERALLDPFVLYLLPVIVALLLLLLALLFVERGEPVKVLELVASIFLAMVFVHAAMRQRVPDLGGGLCYLELFYVVFYCLMVLVLAELFMVGRESKGLPVRLCDRWWVRVFLVPFYVTIMLIVTYVFFG